MQWPLAHCRSALHDVPKACRSRQVVPSQKKPIWQSAWPAQLEAHEPLVQTLGAQFRDEPGWQAPLPSQVLAARSVPPEQLPGAHSLPTAYFRHAPAPSQVPSRPQLAVASWGQSPRGSSPAGTGLQVPSSPDRSHAWQGPGQAVAQQYPSLQILEAHWAPSEHRLPMARAAASGNRSPPGPTSAGGLSGTASVGNPASPPPGWPTSATGSPTKGPSGCPLCAASVHGPASPSSTCGRARSTQAPCATRIRTPKRYATLRYFNINKASVGIGLFISGDAEMAPGHIVTHTWVPTARGRHRHPAKGL